MDLDIIKNIAVVGAGSFIGGNGEVSCLRVDERHRQFPWATNKILPGIFRIFYLT